MAFLAAAGEVPLPYGPPCTAREEVYEFTEKPAVRRAGEDRYEITFAVKGRCDVTVSLVDPAGVIVRHLASGVLGPNAPEPFQKNVLKQTLVWNGRNDLEEYVKDPERLSARVSLGLKPAWDKNLGWHPRNLVGTYRALAIDESGVYVLSGNSSQLRKYSRDGEYLKTVFPPAADLPLERFKGLEALTVEPGRKVLHGYVGHSGARDGFPSHEGFMSTVSGTGVYFPGAGILPQQVCTTKGFLIYAAVRNRAENVCLARMSLADGGSDEAGFAWRSLSRRAGAGWPSTPGYFQSGEFAGSKVQLAVSPDERWLYVSGLVIGRGHAGVYRLDMKTRDPLGKKPFLGEDEKAGSDDAHFQRPAGIDCDGQGRIYVCDPLNNRIQVYAEGGQFLKSLRIDRPELARINRATGELYVVHASRKEGKSGVSLSRLRGLDNPAPAAELALAPGGLAWDPLLALDTWSSPVRLWVTRGEQHLAVIEDQGQEFKLLRDFKEDALKAPVLHDPMLGINFAKVSADPVRDKLVFRNSLLYDLKTGNLEGKVALPNTDDVVFDKRGYMHAHFNPGFYMPGVARMDPRNAKQRGDALAFREVPYDYGIEKTGKFAQDWAGVLPVRDQPGAKFFQDGIAVNMGGEIAVESNIYHVPKMEDSAAEHFPDLEVGAEGGHGYADFVKLVAEMQKRGEEVYTVRRTPGRKLAGGTVWVFERSAELRSENLVPGISLINGVGLDEKGAVYLVTASTRMVNGKAFLADLGEVIGSGKKANNPFTGTLLKAPAKGAEVLSRGAQMPMDHWPQRPPDLADRGHHANLPGLTPWALGKEGEWVEGAEWLYAGASPIVPYSCTCPNLRICTDWHRRTFVPEAYRHSIGVVDTAGNLILHIGQYGNADSGRGPESPVPLGGDGIAVGHAMYVTATDHFLVFSDMANERVTVATLGYHAEALAPVSRP